MANKDKKWESAIANNKTYLMYYNKLKNYAMAMFKWEGLPDSVNERFLEMKMFEEGKILFLEDEDLGHLVMPFTFRQLNHYNEPVDFQAVSINYNKEYNIDNAVPIWNNFSRTPIHDDIQAYAYRLYDIQRTIDVNVKAQKTPVLILADESQRLTMKNAYMQYDGNEPFIFGNKSGFDKDAFQVLKTDAPYVSDKLQVLKNEIWNEAMTFLGIGNSKQDKKERLVADEVQANDEQIQSSRYIMLDARQKACEQINKMFGLDVSVDFKLNIDRKNVEESEVVEDEN